jgi:hypothetical protein
MDEEMVETRKGSTQYPGALTSVRELLHLGSEQRSERIKVHVHSLFSIHVKLRSEKVLRLQALEYP